MHFICLSFLIMFITRQVVAPTLTAEEGQLTVIIEGLENNLGKVRVGLSNSKENYESEGKPFRTAVLDIAEKRASCTFDNLAPGAYALKVYHDENEDGELDKNFLGIPSENYGFSNNARGTFGPASWEDAKFILQTTVDTLNILLE